MVHRLGGGGVVRGVGGRPEKSVCAPGPAVCLWKDHTRRFVRTLQGFSSIHSGQFPDPPPSGVVSKTRSLTGPRTPVLHIPSPQATGFPGYGPRLSLSSPCPAQGSREGPYPGWPHEGALHPRGVCGWPLPGLREESSLLTTEGLPAYSPGPPDCLSLRYCTGPLGCRCLQVRRPPGSGGRDTRGWEVGLARPHCGCVFTPSALSAVFGSICGLCNERKQRACRSQPGLGVIRPQQGVKWPGQASPVP